MGPYLPRSRVSSKITKRILEPVVNFVQRQLLVRRLDNGLKKEKRKRKTENYDADDELGGFCVSCRVERNPAVETNSEHLLLLLQLILSVVGITL